MLGIYTLTFQNLTLESERAQKPSKTQTRKRQASRTSSSVGDGDYARSQSLSQTTAGVSTDDVQRSNKSNLNPSTTVSQSHVAITKIAPKPTQHSAKIVGDVGNSGPSSNPVAITESRSLSVKETANSSAYSSKSRSEKRKTGRHTANPGNVKRRREALADVTTITQPTIGPSQCLRGAMVDIAAVSNESRVQGNRRVVRESWRIRDMKS